MPISAIGGIRGQPVKLAAGDGQRLVDRIDAGQVDQLAADDDENIRRDGAVAIIDRRVFPQPPQAIERGPCRDRADHAVAALHADDAVEIDRANRAAALLEYSPGSLLHFALENAHARRGGGERRRAPGSTPIAFAAISRASVSPTSSLRWRARISEAPIAVARTRWVC